VAFKGDEWQENDNDFTGENLQTFQCASIERSSSVGDFGAAAVFSAQIFGATNQK
jgi:hypothetical protein